MDSERVEKAVDLGERLVTQELNRVAPTYGAKVLDSLLLMVEPGITARLDHVIVDKHGALIVNVKGGDGARVFGNDVQKRWEAHHPNGFAETFQNPVARNREHETVVRQALRETGNWFGADYVKSAVVFGGADLSNLALDSRTRARVVNLSDFETLLHDRHQQPGAGGLSDHQIAGLAGLFRGLDHSGDPEVLQRHADLVLQHVAPEQHALLMNREKPRVTEVPGGTMFTWDVFCPEALVSTVSVTLDPSGKMVAAEIP